ncbi:hypothetical protein HID58_047767 [Brassica napus]|uniref:Replication factor A C-terminal domain-containing protein n=1 Tax=Brassica napus TaxID=3708 RepID=A0ABQ8B0C3_BRANA|nr:hypothetical protein HID58_047767 [Brassica napus]
MDNFTKLEADVVIHERLLQPAFIQKLLFYSDTGHATAAPLLRGYAKVEPLTIAELNEFSDKNEEELSTLYDIYFICIGMITGIKIDKGLCYVSCSNCTRKLQRTVSAFTCVHCNNTNAVGVLRLATYMPYLKAGNQNFRLSYSSLLIRFSDANSLDEITEPASPTPEESFKLRNHTRCLVLPTHTQLPSILPIICSSI